jgi:hypothetical protein
MNDRNEEEKGLSPYMSPSLEGKMASMNTCLWALMKMNDNNEEEKGINSYMSPSLEGKMASMNICLWVLNENE